MCACIRLSSVELMLPRDEGLPVLPVSPCCCWLLYFPCSTSPASDQCNICKGCKLGLNLTQLRGHYTILKHSGGAFTPRGRVPSDLPLEEPTSARDVKCEHVSSNMSSNYWERSFFGNPLNAQSPALAADGSVCPNTKGVGLGQLGADDLQDMATRKDSDTLQWLSRLPDSPGG